MPPAPWIFFVLQGSPRLASFFVARSASVNYWLNMWHFCHNSEARLVRELSEEAVALGKHRPKSVRRRSELADSRLKPFIKAG